LKEKSKDPTTYSNKRINSKILENNTTKELEANPEQHTDFYISQ